MFIVTVPRLLACDAVRCLDTLQPEGTGYPGFTVQTGFPIHDKEKSLTTLPSANGAIWYEVGPPNLSEQ